jgi:hypothetical protein
MADDSVEMLRRVARALEGRRRMTRFDAMPPLGPASSSAIRERAT